MLIKMEWWSGLNQATKKKCKHLKVRMKVMMTFGRSGTNLLDLPQTYKSYFLCGDVVVNPVAGAAGAAVPGVVALGRPLALRVAGVVAHEAGAAHQQVEQEAEHLHGDGDQEEDERVAPFVLDEQLGEDSGQRDDHPRRAWTAVGGE